TQRQVGLLLEAQHLLRLHVVVEQAEVGELQSFDEVALLVRNGKDEVDLVDADFDGLGSCLVVDGCLRCRLLRGRRLRCGLRRGLLLRRGSCGGRCLGGHAHRRCDNGGQDGECSHQQPPRLDYWCSGLKFVHRSHSLDSINRVPLICSRKPCNSRGSGALINRVLPVRGCANSRWAAWRKLRARCRFDGASCPGPVFSPRSVVSAVGISIGRVLTRLRLAGDEPLCDEASSGMLRGAPYSVSPTTGWPSDCMCTRI